MATARLGDVLLRMGVITASQLEQAMALQQRHKVRLGQILVDHGFADERRVVDALAQVSNLPRLDLETVTIDPAASRWITKEWSELHLAVPVSVDRQARTLSVAVADPTDVAPLDELAFRTGLKVNPVLGSDREVHMLHRHVFHGSPLARSRKSVVRPGQAEVEHTADLEAPQLIYGMDAIRDHLMQDARPSRVSFGIEAPKPTPPPRGDSVLHPRLHALLEAQQEAARELQILFEMCVARGIVTREEYVARLMRQEP